MDDPNSVINWIDVYGVMGERRDVGELATRLWRRGDWVKKVHPPLLDVDGVPTAFNAFPAPYVPAAA